MWSYIVYLLNHEGFLCVLLRLFVLLSSCFRMFYMYEVTENKKIQNQNEFNAPVTLFSSSQTSSVSVQNTVFSIDGDKMVITDVFIYFYMSNTFKLVQNVIIPSNRRSQDGCYLIDSSFGTWNRFSVFLLSGLFFHLTSFVQQVHEHFLYENTCKVFICSNMVIKCELGPCQTLMWTQWLILKKLTALHILSNIQLWI